MIIKTTEQIRYKFTKLQYNPKEKWIKVRDIRKELIVIIKAKNYSKIKCKILLKQLEE